MAPSDRTSQLQRKRALERHFATDFGTLAYPLLANTYYQEGDMVRARKVCSIGLKHHPEHGPGLFLLAMVNMREGRMEEAEQLLDRTLAQDPYHVEAAEYLVAVQERLKRPPGILERAYKILLLANPLSHSARARLKRMQAEKELVQKVKREMRLREEAARPPTSVGGPEPAGELRPLSEEECLAKVTDTAESEPAPFVPTSQPEEPPLDIFSDEEAERAERIGARLEESDQLTEAERAWERHIKEVATELAQEEQVPEPIAESESTPFPLEDYGTGESEPVVTTTAGEAEQPAEQPAPVEEGAAALPATEGDETIASALAEESLMAAGPAVEAIPEPVDERLWPGEEDDEVDLEAWPGKEQTGEPTEDVTPAEEVVSTEPAAESGETETPAPGDESLLAEETVVAETPEPLKERLWPGEEEGADELEAWPGKEQAGEPTEDVTPAEEVVSTESAAESGKTETTVPMDESLLAEEAAVDKAPEPVDEQLWPGEDEEEDSLEPWPETIAVAETTGESTGADSAETTSEATPSFDEEPALEVVPETEPEGEIAAEAEFPDTQTVKDELAPDFFDDRPPVEETETVKVAPEGGEEKEDTWATYLKPENVLGDDSLTVEVEISAEGDAPSVAAQLGDLEKELTAGMDAEETEPALVEPEIAAEPEIEPATQPEQPEVPADDEPPSLSIAARLAQMREELSAKYAPKESSAPKATKAESKPETEATQASPEAQGEEVGDDTETDAVADVEAEMEVAGAAFDEGVSPPETVEEAGKPPTDKASPVADAAAEPEIEVQAATTDESAVASPVEPEPAPVALAIEPEVEPVEDTAEAVVEDDSPTDAGLPAEEAPEPPAERSSDPTDANAAMYVDPKLATFTLVDIYQVQGLYQQALQALDILENKGGDPERIKRERATITAAMRSGSKSE